mgnify:CR=1 FL=1
MSKWPVRRAQLIAPFGVGAMTILRNGISVIACGLDHWFEREGLDDQDDIEIEEFVLREWRLERMLKVNHFRLPPDHRLPHPGDQNKNCRLTVPFLRFPEWHFCPVCHLLVHVPSTHVGIYNCRKCLKEKRSKVSVLQVPFVAMCEQGHIQDFPWREWAHGNSQAACDRDIRLYATGGASLAAQKVTCDCGATRTLGGITEHSEGGSFLSKNLDGSGSAYLCQGRMPWLGQGASEECGSPLKGTLRSASNVYFAHIRSAIYVPKEEDEGIEELVETLKTPSFQAIFSITESMRVTLGAADLRKHYAAPLRGYSDGQIERAINAVARERRQEDPQNAVDSDSPEMAFRREEYQVLTRGKRDGQLVARPYRASQYETWIGGFLDYVVLIDKLRETRVLSGFSRVLPENSRNIEAKKNMLWRHSPNHTISWLPGCKILGEGILLVLNEEALMSWERSKRQALAKRLAPLFQRQGQMQQARGLEPRSLSARFVLLHTLAHVFMNRLTFECGYSSASIRERLYISDAPEAPMAGVLIYTASGDSEGTLGGLVRMGEPGQLEPVFRRALETAQWCAADPVCMEQGDRGGQGPDSCNLAACHNCALVPETACEEFNRFLDRGLLVGTPNADIGFFRGANQ